MANTFELIQATTVGAGGTSSIDFNSIQPNWTDLVLKYCCRITANDSSWHLKINGSSSSIYSGRYLYGAGSGSGASGSWSSAANDNFLYVNGSGTTTSTFSNGELYFPNYASSTTKSYSTDQVTENNGTTAYAFLTGATFASNSAITSLSLYYTGTSNDIAQYSTAYLYGVKNA